MTTMQTDLPTTSTPPARTNGHAGGAARARRSRNDAAADPSRPAGQPRRRTARRMAGEYAFAALVVAVALATTLGLWGPIFSRNPFALFYAAVIVAAWFGGVGPGLAATGLAIAAIDVFIVPSFVSPLRGWQDLVQVGTFVFITLLVSSLDATRRHAMDALRAAKESAETANQAKDQFLAVLSHELRTPLTPALVAAGSLETDPSFSAGVRSELGMIRRNIELEARLIDDLLDLSRISRGKLRLKAETIDARSVLAEVVGICRGAAEEKGIRLSVDSGTSAAWVGADGARFRQVLWNLLNNAVKFTPAGGAVRVRLCLEGGAKPGAEAKRESSPADLGRVRIEVEDTGAGIAPSVLPFIFNAFEQGGSSVTRQFGGLGLGLAIARAIVTQHGGSITAASDGPGAGARFTVRLPRVAAPAGAVAAPQTSAPAAPAQAVFGLPTAARRLLLVEDHADTSRALSKVLRAQGYEVEIAATCAAAREAAVRDRFDLLLSDLGLPDGTGLGLLREIGRQFPRGAIALSGYGMEQDVTNALAVGFAAHLTKPVDLEQLARTLDAAFATRSAAS